MKHYCQILNKKFNTKEDMFKALVENKEDIINMKKAAVKFSDPTSLRVMKTDTELKGLQPKESLEYGDYIYPVINTSKYLDSHGDVHIDGLWDKSAKEQKDKVYLVINHELEVGKVISWPKDVTVMVEELKWSDLGADYDGKTQALIFKSKLTPRSNKDAFESYKEGDPVQHSIRMQYVKMRMAINNKDYKEEYDAWKTYYPMIANKERADEEGYFFAIIEAKIFREGSMVLAGSNDVTPTLYDFEPEKSTQQKQEPSVSDTLNYLTNNFKLN